MYQTEYFLVEIQGVLLHLHTQIRIGHSAKIQVKANSTQTKYQVRIYNNYILLIISLQKQMQKILWFTSELSLKESKLTIDQILMLEAQQ